MESLNKPVIAVHGGARVKPVIAVHGGAASIPQELLNVRLHGVKEAVLAGFKVSMAILNSDKSTSNEYDFRMQKR